MSHRLLSYLFVVAIAASTLSCKKFDDEEFKPKTTDLRVKIFDYYSYGAVEGVEVFIYHTQTNFFLRTGEVRQGLTNSAGEILFEDLEPYNYFIYVRKLLDTTYYRSTSSSNEAYDIKYNIGEPLIKNSLTTVSIPVEEYFLPKKFGIYGATRISKSGISNDFIHLDLIAEDEVMGGESLLEVAEDVSLTKDKSIFSSDLPYDGVAEWTFTDFDNNYYWGDSTIYFRHYRSPDGDRSNETLVTPDVIDGYLVDGTLETSLLRFINDKTYGVPIYKAANGDLYKLNIEWY